MNTEELYKIQVETFRHYLDHMVKLLLIYLAVLGALFKFSLDKDATAMMFSTLVPIGILFCIWSEYGARIHYRATEALGKSIDKLVDDLKIRTHQADTHRFLQFIVALELFNFIVLLSFLYLLWIGPEIKA